MFDQDIVLSAGALTIFATMLVAVVGALGTLFKMLLAAKDAQLASALEQRDAYMLLSRNALLSLERAWRDQRAAAGLEPVRLPTPPPDLPPADLQARMDAVAAALAHGGPIVEDR